MNHNPHGTIAHLSLTTRPHSNPNSNHAKLDRQSAHLCWCAFWHVSPTSASSCERAYRRHLRRQRALCAIQRAAFRHLYLPGGWAERQSRRELAEMQQLSG
eukprot:3657834-Prymnesium_polylepis.1